MTKLIISSAVLIAALALLGGCASVEPKQFNALAAQVAGNRAAIAKINQQSEASRRPRAEMVADVASLRQEMAVLRGQAEELRHQVGSGPRAEALAQSEQRLIQRQQELDARLAKLEAVLGMGKGAPAQAAKPGAPVRRPAPAPVASAKSTYELGHRLLKQKSYQAARDRFKQVFKKWPKSKYAPSAQYWVGNTYFDQKKYEEAILAYNQVIKRYSRSSKVPSALLKQGLAFKYLGDKRTASIVFKRLVAKYPKSNQAKTAKRYLKKL